MRPVPDGALTARHIQSDPRIRRASRILWDRIDPIASREVTVPEA
ncbi:hypothetical protein [Brachybacterium halotolerans]|nr:hypothetical protein [Brachybacterium halotolerans]